MSPLWSWVLGWQGWGRSGSEGAGGWGGRAQGWPGFSPWGDCACALGKGLQWDFCSMFSLLSLVQQESKGLDSTMCLDQKLPFEIPVSTFPTLAEAMKQQSMGTLKQRWEPVHCTDFDLQNYPRGPRKHLSINGNISFNCFAFQKQPNQLWPALAVFAGGCFPECSSELAWWDTNLSNQERLSWGGLHFPHASLVCLHVISMGTILGDAAVPCTWILVLLKPL